MNLAVRRVSCDRYLKDFVELGAVSRQQTEFKHEQTVLEVYSAR